MYVTSATWGLLLAQNDHWIEPSVVIGETGRLINEEGFAIKFGSDTILTGRMGPESGYQIDRIRALSTSYKQFSGSEPSVGSCLAAELDLTMLRPVGDIPRRSVIKPYVRLAGNVTSGTQSSVLNGTLRLSGSVSATGDELSFGEDSGAAVAMRSLILSNESGLLRSEWIPQGVFWVDTKEYTQNDDGLNLVSIHGFDAMLMTEQIYPNVDHEWVDVKDIEVVEEIAGILGVNIDPRTYEVITRGYIIPAPIGYSLREVLGNIAGMYAGNFVFNYDGELLLVTINSAPPETSYLTDEFGYVILCGGDRILV